MIGPAGRPSQPGESGLRAGIPDQRGPMLGEPHSGYLTATPHSWCGRLKEGCIDRQARTMVCRERIFSSSARKTPQNFLAAVLGLGE